MGTLRDVLGAVVVGGMLAWGSYALWYAAQDWTRHTVLADFPYLVGLGAVLAFLGLAEWLLTVGKTWLGRGSHGLS